MAAGFPGFCIRPLYQKRGTDMNRREFLQQGTSLTAAAGFAIGRQSLADASSRPVGRAGFAEADITPEIGMEQPGGYGKSFHKSLHDACKVRVAVFDDGIKRVALIGADSLTVPDQLVKDTRKEIQARCGFAPEAILIGASHSHSSGPTGMVQPGEYDHASPLVQKLAYQQSSCADSRYLQLMRRQIVAAVSQAEQSLAEAKCSFGVGVEDKAAFNRRFRMKNGLTFTHPGQCNPDIVEVAGPIDPHVGVIGAWDQKGNLMGVVVNYACHATTSPGGISANWIYYLEKTIRGAMGADVPVVFLQGACGDVTQVDNLNPHPNPTGEQWAKLVGGRVGAEAVRVLLSTHAGEFGPVDARGTILTFNRRIPTPERVKRCLEMVQKDPKEVGVTNWTFAKEILMLDALIAKNPKVQAEVQAIQVGPAVFVANPAELFCQLGLDIRAGSRFPITIPVELANGVVGYVPTEEAFGPKGGGYETRLTAYSNLEVTAGIQMVKAGIQLTRQMNPGVIPEPRKEPPSHSPWEYGSVPAELA
jgi:neutral ceramidase